jgi:hypothetical protein
VSQGGLDDRELFERTVLRPIFFISTFSAGYVLGIGIERMTVWLILLGVGMFAVYYTCAEVYWRSVYAARVALKAQVQQLQENVQATFAWSDRWKSVAMGHGDPWKGKENADA